jgi:hypothetical protein
MPKATKPKPQDKVDRDALDQIPKPDRSSYTPLDFLGWREGDGLVLTPKFQRRGVWTTPARSFLIETLIRRLPVPPIYLRVRQSDDKRRLVREVVDGQQRIAAVLDFVDNKFALSRTLPSPYGGKTFKSLPAQFQDAVRQYSFICEVLQGVSDAQVLEIFRRLNTYSVQLNAQELRNGRYFGYFKQSCYKLALEHVEFWRKHRIVGERGIARMQEVELASELLITQLDGLQDKKVSINRFYADFDDEFANQRTVESQFRNNVDTIGDAVGDILADTNFRRIPLFYTLYTTVHHRQHGLPGLMMPTRRKPLTENERGTLRNAIQKLSDIVQLAYQGETVPKRYDRFVIACLRQTDNIGPRRTRLETVYSTAF